MAGVGALFLLGSEAGLFFEQKRRHERFAARAGRPVTQTTPGEKEDRYLLITGISTRYYRFTGKQIQKSKFSVDFFFSESKAYRTEFGRRSSNAY